MSWPVQTHLDCSITFLCGFVSFHYFKNNNYRSDISMFILTGLEPVYGSCIVMYQLNDDDLIISSGLYGPTSAARYVKKFFGVFVFVLVLFCSHAFL